MSNIDLIQEKLPRFYRKYPIKGENERSNMYPVLLAFSSLLDSTYTIVDRIDGMVGIDTTHNEDLYHRWGSILGISKGNGSWELFRNKIKLAMLSGVGGTKQAIKFAVAIIASIEDNAELQDKYIQVIDAWEYKGRIIPHSYDPYYDITTNGVFTLNDDFETNKRYDPHKYGAFVVIMDLLANEEILTPDDGTVIDTVNTVKAAGTNAYIIYVYTTEDKTNIDIDDNLFTHICDSKNDIGMIPIYGPQPDDSSVFGYATFGEAIFNKFYDRADTFNDTIMVLMSEECSFNAKYSNIWGYGTNDPQALLNDTFITNRYAKTDEYHDNVITNEKEVYSLYTVDVVIDGIIDVIYKDIGFITDQSKVFRPELNGLADTNDTLETNPDKIFTVPNEHHDDVIICTSDNINISHNTDRWSVLGTNHIAIMLNSTFVTNMVMDVDEHIDIIQYKR